MDEFGAQLHLPVPTSILTASNRQNLHDNHFPFGVGAASFGFFFSFMKQPHDVCRDRETNGPFSHSASQNTAITFNLFLFSWLVKKIWIFHISFAFYDVFQISSCIMWCFRLILPLRSLFETRIVKNLKIYTHTRIQKGQKQVYDSSQIKWFSKRYLVNRSVSYSFTSP